MMEISGRAEPILVQVWVTVIRHIELFEHVAIVPFLLCLFLSNPESEESEPHSIQDNSAVSLAVSLGVPT